MRSDGPQCERQLDALALLACQNYNLGNRGNWFFSFRSGFSGFRSRLLSLEEHRGLLYEWHAQLALGAHERHLAIILFCMDSAVECTVFALNALGQAKFPQGFRDVTDEAALRRISPRDVLGGGKGLPLAGWNDLYPNFQRHCISHASLLTLLMDNHDVTKHRQSGFWGGTIRSDPPPGFFETLGIPPGGARLAFAPMESVMIPLAPKLPMEDRPSDLAQWTKLEDLIRDFFTFMHEAICFSSADAQARLDLPVKSLRK